MDLQFAERELEWKRASVLEVILVTAFYKPDCTNMEEMRPRIIICPTVRILRLRESEL